MRKKRKPSKPSKKLLEQLREVAEVNEASRAEGCKRRYLPCLIECTCPKEKAHET